MGLFVGSPKTWWGQLQPVWPVATGYFKPVTYSAGAEPLLQGSLGIEPTVVATVGRSPALLTTYGRVG